MRSFLRRLLGLGLILTSTQQIWAAAPFSQFVDPHPSINNRFGKQVIPLSTGNVVITATDTYGSVYLFNGATGALISEIHGSSSSLGGYIADVGVVALTNGNFVIISSSWSDSYQGLKGAVTWASGITGISGEVSRANSLVGAAGGDSIGSGGVRALSNGNYVVISPGWDNGEVTAAGAVTWGNGATGTVGIVSADNSLVGQSQYDAVGSGGVTALTNGNYVVGSPSWSNGPVKGVSAVTWCDGFTYTSATVTAANSLVGSNPNDQLGSRGVKALRNGNFLVISPLWDNGSASNTGAVTWGSGVSGISGPVSTSNSLVSHKAKDQIGSGGVTELDDGNYVVSSPSCDNGVADRAGAATWANGKTGIKGLVDSSNSLVGANPYDEVGIGGVVSLPNHYLVVSPNWKNGTGAVTRGTSATGIRGNVAVTNSLLGGKPDDWVGSGGVTPLTNGNYVVSSPHWNNGSAAHAGAVTWCDAATKGVVTRDNSLIGNKAEDHVGASGVVALTNGNYVVGSFEWDNSNMIDAGAATWGDGTKGIKGMISRSNSLVGERPGDCISSSRIAALRNGNYTVSSPFWDKGFIADAGAVTLGNGLTGITGAVTSHNSVVGEGSDQLNHIAQGTVIPLANGNYISASIDSSGQLPLWGSGSMIASNLMNVALTGSFYLPAIVLDDLNGTFIAPFMANAGNKVFVGSQADGFSTAPVMGVQYGANTLVGNHLEFVSVGDSTVGSSVEIPFTISNTGNADLVIGNITTDGPNPLDFTVNAPPNASVAPGGSISLTITFTRRASGIRGATIHIASNSSGNENPFIIRLISVPGPEIAIEQPKNNILKDDETRKDLGKLKCNTTGEVKTFTIRNIGSVKLTGLSTKLEGANRLDFTVSAPTKSSLLPGTSATFKVTFKPKTKGRRTAMIQIKSNDQDENPFGIQITGFGT